MVSGPGGHGSGNIRTNQTPRTRRRFHRSTGMQPDSESPRSPRVATSTTALSAVLEDHNHEDELDYLDHYRLVNELWHFASVDSGERCECPHPFDNFNRES